MIYYVLYILIIFFGLSKYIKLNVKTKEKIMIWGPAVLLTIVAGLRSSYVGTDTANYERIFLNMTWREVLDSGSIIYNLYCFVLKSIFPNTTIFNLINAALINFSVAYFIKKYAQSASCSWLCYLGMGFFFDSMNQCREFISIAITLWVFDAVIEKKNKRLLILSILAVMVHNISIVSIVVMFIIRWFDKIKWRHIIIAIIFLDIVARNYEQFIYLFTNIFPNYRVYLSDWVGLFDSTSIGTSSIIYILLYAFLEIVTLFYYFRYNSKVDKIKRAESAMLVLNGCNLLFTLLMFKVDLLRRIAMLFSIIIIVMLPNAALRYIKNKSTVSVILMCFFLLFMIFVLKSDGSGVVPYSSIFVRD